MRGEAQAEKIGRFMEALGQRARGPGRVYLVGGATAVLLGWRPTTVDLNLKLDPEPPGAFAAIAALKDELELNVELASPDQFVLALPGWRERSLFVARHGRVDFLHYDPYGQALAKIDRGHTRDLADVRELLGRGLVAPAELRRLLAAVTDELPRYPAVDPDALRKKLEAALEDWSG